MAFMNQCSVTLLASLDKVFLADQAVKAGDGLIVSIEGLWQYNSYFKKLVTNH